MEIKLECLSSGSVTSPKGFHAGATCAGIKKGNILDLAILFSEKPCSAAGLFTSNRVKAAPVVLSSKKLESGRASAVVVNSGCANACTGEQGLADAAETAEIVARNLGVPAEVVLVASTGVIGQSLPMENLRAGLKKIVLSPEGGHELARAIMTTDTVPKEIAVRNVEDGFIIGGVVKGAGMIHPNLATMLSFLTTDASIAADLLKESLQKAADISFNMISVDGDTSTNDTLLIMSNGLSGGKPILRGSREAEAFQQALNKVCTHLAKSIVRDGEGASKLIEVNVRGAPTVAEARLAARTVIASSLVKTAVHGSDPNWGRFLAVIGRSGVPIEENKIDLNIGGIAVVKKGAPLSFDVKKVVEVLDKKEIPVIIDLNLGDARATAWGCDLSEEYVRINSQYTT